jgi:hypothetical protein
MSPISPEFFLKAPAEFYNQYRELSQVKAIFSLFTYTSAHRTKLLA